MLKLGKYIWKANGVDYPVTVVKFLGKGPDGREYARVLDSNSAVPVDELCLLSVDVALTQKEIKSTSKKPLPKRLFGL